MRDSSELDSRDCALTSASLCRCHLRHFLEVSDDSPFSRYLLKHVAMVVDLPLVHSAARVIEITYAVICTAPPFRLNHKVKPGKPETTWKKYCAKHCDPHKCKLLEKRITNTSAAEEVSSPRISRQG